MTDKGKKVHFIIIDDSELDCFIASKMVIHTGKCLSVKSFLNAVDALEYIRKIQTPVDDYITIILLDILMPIMNGIEFVEEFETLPEAVQALYQIVAFTSSMNKKDMNRMKSYKSVRFLLDKPLTEEVLQRILKD